MAGAKNFPSDRPIVSKYSMLVTSGASTSLNTQPKPFTTADVFVPGTKKVTVVWLVGREAPERKSGVKRRGGLNWANVVVELGSRFPKFCGAGWPAPLSVVAPLTCNSLPNTQTTTQSGEFRL